MAFHRQLYPFVNLVSIPEYIVIIYQHYSSLPSHCVSVTWRVHNPNITTTTNAFECQSCFGQIVKYGEIWWQNRQFGVYKKCLRDTFQKLCVIMMCWKLLSSSSKQLISKPLFSLSLSFSTYNYLSVLALLVPNKRLRHSILYCLVSLWIVSTIEFYALVLNLWMM